jgi:hypothetical protein
MAPQTDTNATIAQQQEDEAMEAVFSALSVSRYYKQTAIAQQ